MSDSGVDDLLFDSEGLMRLLDDLVSDGTETRWDNLYSGRPGNCPFLVDDPDENVVDWFNTGCLRPGRVLELGCGNGRNAAFLAEQGCAVDAVDLSPVAVTQARQRLAERGLPGEVRCGSVYDLDLADGAYDLIYDSGCFHHQPPHRRRTYVDFVHRALRAGGAFGLVCFRPAGGSGLSDRQVYERRTLGGGLGYSADQLRNLWEHRLRVRVLRPMRSPKLGEPLFGQDFLWTMLADRP